MNHSLALIASVLESRDIATPIKAGIKPKMLTDEARLCWEILADSHEKHQEIPSVDFFRSIVSNYDHVPPTDCIEAIIAEVKTQYLYSELQAGLKHVAELSGQDPWIAKAELGKISDTLNMELQLGGNDLIAGEDSKEILHMLELLQRGGGLLGMPWPWDYLNENSMGVMGGNFIYLYGREKSRKTWLLLFLGLFWEAMGYRVLFITREMSIPEVAWRLYPMRAGLDFQEMSQGQVSTDGKITLERAMANLALHKNFIISEVSGGMAGVRAKVEEVKPNIIIHDYMKGIAEDEIGDKVNAKEHQYVAAIADKMKQMARKYNIPVIACGHANREGVKLKGRGTEEVAHADHIVRRADLVLRIMCDDSTNRIALIVAAGRSVRKFLGWTIDAHLNNHFGDYLNNDISWTDEADSMTKASEKSKESNPEAERPLKEVTAGLKTFKLPSRRT